MTGQPLRPDGDLASFCFGDGLPSPERRRLVVAALNRVVEREVAPRDDGLPSDLLRAALAATSGRAVGNSQLGQSESLPLERAAAGTVRASRFVAWAGLAAGVAGFCLVSWLIFRPSTDAGPQQASVVASSGMTPEGPSPPSSVSAIGNDAADVRLVPLTPELRRGLRRFADDPAGARQDLLALLPGMADRGREIALSDRLVAVLRADGAASVIRVERSGPALRLQLPDEAP